MESWSPSSATFGHRGQEEAPGLRHHTQDRAWDERNQPTSNLQRDVLDWLAKTRLKAPPLPSYQGRITKKKQDIARRINEANKHALHRHREGAQVHDRPRGVQLSGGELTPTMKLKRSLCVGEVHGRDRGDVRERDPDLHVVDPVLHVVDTSPSCGRPSPPSLLCKTN